MALFDRKSDHGDLQEAHITRLKFYHDSSLAVTEELLTHASNSGIGYLVDQLLEYLRNSGGQSEIKVKWAGFQPADDTWEPATIIFQDVHKILKNFIKTRPRCPYLEAFAAALGVSLPEEGGAGT